MTIFSKIWHTHSFRIIKEVDTCERHEIWTLCECGRENHAVIRDEPLHKFGKWTYGKGVNHISYRGVKIQDEPCQIRYRLCEVCGLEEIERA